MVKKYSTTLVNLYQPEVRAAGRQEHLVRPEPPPPYAAAPLVPLVRRQGDVDKLPLAAEGVEGGDEGGAVVVPGEGEALGLAVAVAGRRGHGLRWWGAEMGA